MKKQEIGDYIQAHKLVAIIRGVKREEIPETAAAIYNGGIRCLEITIDHSTESSIQESYEKISLLTHIYEGEMAIGAGTVLSIEEVERAIEAGAEYIISPNTDEQVIRRTAELGRVSMPGAFTPSEIVVAYEAGADMVKLFPAGLLGIPYINAVRGPLSHIPMVAVGGITPENCVEFINAGCVGLGIGGNLARLDLIEKKEFCEIEKISRSYVDQIKKGKREVGG